MPGTYTQTLKTESYNGTVSINTGLFIAGQWVDPVEPDTLDIINPATGRVITPISLGSSKDVDIAVAAAAKAFKESWGLKVPGSVRGQMLNKLADLIERDADEIAALEALDVGWNYATMSKRAVSGTVGCYRYYAGLADKLQGKTIETNDMRFAYTKREPYGVVGLVVPWNFPLSVTAWKVGPALATGNSVILKPSELAPLSALKLASLINEAGFPPGSFNLINGYGNTVGQAICEHPKIGKVAFTGSTLTGRKVLKASADSNLKVVTLELGGKSPTIIFDDADVEQAVKWASMSVFMHSGQMCIAGSRIFVHEAIYDKFIKGLAGSAQYLAANAGGQFVPTTLHGPLISQTQFDKVLGYIQSGKDDGAKVITGGERIGDEGYFVKPTIFADCTPDMKIVKEEIFGPVAAVTKFKTEEEVIELANDTMYGLGFNVFTENMSRAIRISNAAEAGSVWVNCASSPDVGVPFGGYKQSGIGFESGQEALEIYTQLKAVHINIGRKL
ncbi:aldehyde dehydrogenase [Cyathus striatus]|nr:aldehyde dehydrogenase [Cyathus striatus]